MEAVSVGAGLMLGLDGDVLQFEVSPELGLHSLAHNFGIRALRQNDMNRGAGLVGA